MLREEKNTAIFTAYDELEPYDVAKPERNLLRAILLNAMADLKRPGAAARRAAEYFLSPEDDYIFSFRAICSYLSVDPKRVLTVAGLRRPAKAGAQEAASLPGKDS
jgi:hypothetical protein